MIGPGDIIAYAEQFADVAPQKIQLYINYAKLSVPAKKWGEKFDFGLLNLTCHLLTMSKIAMKADEKGSLGPVTIEKTGDLSTSYSEGGQGGGAIPSNASLEETHYGREFLRLQRSLVKTPFVVV